MNLLTEESFFAIQRTAFQAYTTIQGEVAKVGGTTRDALLPMQTYLQQAAFAAKEFGIPLDENTQMMIDQSKELGIWKELGPSAMELMTSALNTLIGRIDTLLSKLFGLPDELPNPFEGWEIPEMPEIPYEPGGEPPNRTDTPEFAGGTISSGGKWFKNFGKETPALLHNMEAVITPSQAVPFAEDILKNSGRVTVPRMGSLPPMTFNQTYITNVPKATEDTIYKIGTVDQSQEIINHITQEVERIPSILDNTLPPGDSGYNDDKYFNIGVDKEMPDYSQLLDDKMLEGVHRPQEDAAFGRIYSDMEEKQGAINRDIPINLVLSDRRILAKVVVEDMPDELRRRGIKGLATTR